MLDSDWIRLGLKPRDLIRTPHIEVSEVVEFELKLREIRELLVNFWIKGAAHKAKPSGYDGAVIIWDVLDAPPPAPPTASTATQWPAKRPTPLNSPKKSAAKPSTSPPHGKTNGA
jgi:hypothetical protein